MNTTHISAFDRIKDRSYYYALLMRMNRPIGTYLLLWPTVWGLWIAGEGNPDTGVTLVFVLGVILMRSAGCVINDYADRDFDAHVARTMNGPLAAGKVSGKEALLLAGALSVLAFLLILPLNRLVMILSVPALFLAASYPYTKRFFSIPQAYLGIAFGFGIPMAFAAQLGSVPLDAWLLLIANVFLAVAYATVYSMVARAVVIKIGMKSSALTFGRFDVMAVMLCYAATLILLAYVGWRHGRGLWFDAGLGVAALIAIYHYTLIRTRDRAGCFKAFLHNNWLGAAVFAGLALDYWLR